MTEVDVAVVGAGAAGIAAARRVVAAGASVALVEARARVGGRAHTDPRAFPGIPFDRGAHWLHAAGRNPLRAHADRLGFRYDSRVSFRTRFLLTGGGARAPAAEAQAAVRAALDRAAARGQGEDVPLSACLDPSDVWHRLVWRTLSQMVGADPDLCSTRDLARYDDPGEDWPVEDGYGALVSRLAEGLPLTLCTPVTRIDLRGTRAMVETARGSLSARAVIVTLATTVLAQGGIAFAPALPPEVEAALHDCPLGHFEKIALALDRPLPDLAHAYTDVIDGPPLGREPVNLHLQPFGRPLLVAHLGGRAAAMLVAEGEAAMAAAGREVAAHAFGSAILPRIRSVAVTRWAADPWSAGSYSHCLPGRAGARALLGRPIQGRLFLAGEHLSETAFGTVHGAWASGEAAAERALGSLAGGTS